MESKKTTSILLLILLVTITSCQKSLTKKSLSYGDNLKSAIENFEGARHEFAQNVTESVENTSANLSKENSELLEVAIDWEEKWNDIQNRFQKLEKEFSVVGQVSEQYFNQLHELSAGINDRKIKASEIQKNEALKNEWTVAFVKASNDIQKIRDVLIEGNDFHRVLVASSIRQKIETNIIELESISIRANNILNELEKFTIEGKKLVS